MKMFATYTKEEYKKFKNESIITFSNGTSNEEPVILVQSSFFNDQEYIPSIIIEFEKKLKDIFIDWDDDVEAESNGNLVKEGDVTYEKVKEEQLKDHRMYGSFVKEIRKEEIIAIHDAIWYADEGKFIVDGKEVK